MYSVVLVNNNAWCLSQELTAGAAVNPSNFDRIRSLRYRPSRRGVRTLLIREINGALQDQNFGAMGPEKLLVHEITGNMCQVV